jgi:hypothetical protein
VVFEAEIKDKKWLIIDGFGSSEKRTMIDELTDDWDLIRKGTSGAMRFYSKRLRLYNHITCGGWSEYFPLPCIIELDKELEKQISELKQVDKYQIAQSDFATIMKLLRANIVRKYRIFKDIDVSEIEFYPEFADLLPLLKAYKRGRELTFPQNVFIVELANSFTSVFKLKNIEFRIPKRKDYITYEFSNYVEIDLTKNLFIIYKYDQFQDKAIVYFVEKNNTYFAIKGYEQYQDILHRPVLLSISHDKFTYRIFDLFFDYRLGDILFVPYEAHFSEIIEYFRPARREQFDKISIENAEIMDNILRPINTQRIRIFHPEHGLLELESTTEYKCLTFTTTHD